MTWAQFLRTNGVERKDVEQMLADGLPNDVAKFLRGTVMHEFGHALGLAHTNNTADIMHQYVECNMVITDEIKSTLAELYSDKVDEYVDFHFA